MRLESSDGHMLKLLQAICFVRAVVFCCLLFVPLISNFSVFTSSTSQLLFWWLWSQKLGFLSKFVFWSWLGIWAYETLSGLTQLVWVSIRGAFISQSVAKSFAMKPVYCLVPRVNRLNGTKQRGLPEFVQ